MPDGSSASEIAGWIRSIRAAWRRQAGGGIEADTARSTLVAVSGGADSAALAIALGTLDNARIVLGHVSHDLRPAELVRDDMLAVELLANRLGCRLVHQHVRTREGNAEAEARRSRYLALADMALREGLSHVATGHHARDQLETMLLAILRGGSPSAIAGIRPSRLLGRSVKLIRPMLHADSRQVKPVCAQYGYMPRCDATNADPARARAHLRQQLVEGLFAERNPARGVSAAAARLRRLVAQQPPDIGFEPLEF